MKKGEIIYFAEYKRGAGYSGLYKSLLIEVGKIYFRTSDNSKRIQISKMIDGDRADPHKRYFLSESAFFEWKESLKLRQKIDNYFSAPYNLSIEKLRLIDVIISH